MINHCLTGSFILEIYETYKSKIDVELGKVPKHMQFMSKEYLLRGIIMFKSPVVTRKCKKNVIGHFTAVI